MTTDEMTADESLARVTYLPGVTPPVAGATQELAESDLHDGQRRAQSASMRALTRRGMSRWELGELLLSHELDSGIVESELDRLEGVGLIDDAALAETIVRTKHERKGLGRSALVAELRRRHIDQATIECAIDAVSDEDEASRAIDLATRRAQQLLGLDHGTAVRRLSSYLQRKGYSFDTVRIAVATALPRGAPSTRAASSVRFR